MTSDKAKKGVKAVAATPPPVPGRAFHKVEVDRHELALHGTQEAQDRLNRALATASKDFADYAFLQLVNLLKGKDETSDLTQVMNAALAMIEAVAPRSEAEAMLALQMVATHHMTMEANRRWLNAGDMPRCEAYSNMATKFARTYGAQLEALGRHRRGGKQVVEHVHVNAGGQAVIAGTVNHGTGG